MFQFSGKSPTSPPKFTSSELSGEKFSSRQQYKGTSSTSKTELLSSPRMHTFERRGSASERPSVSTLDDSKLKEIEEKSNFFTFFNI